MIEWGTNSSGDRYNRKEWDSELPKHHLHAFVSRGANLGELLLPHKHDDGSYVVSKTRFEDDYVRVAKETEILALARKGIWAANVKPRQGYYRSKFDIAGVDLSTGGPVKGLA